MIRSLLFFVHVSGMLLLFVGFVVEWLSLASLRRATSATEASPWLRMAEGLSRLYGAAFLLLLASGIYLAAQAGLFEFAWVRISFLGMLAMGIAGGVTIRRVVRASEWSSGEKRNRSGSKPESPSDRFWVRLSLRMRVALALSVVYLMIGKLELLESLLVVGIALSLALVASLGAARADRRQLGTDQHHSAYSR